MSRHQRDRGASAVEYGLLIVAIAGVIVSVVFQLGGFVDSTFSKTCSAMVADPASMGDQTACLPPAVAPSPAGT